MMRLFDLARLNLFDFEIKVKFNKIKFNKHQLKLVSYIYTGIVELSIFA